MRSAEVEYFRDFAKTRTPILLACSTVFAISAIFMPLLRAGFATSSGARICWLVPRFSQFLRSLCLYFVRASAVSPGARICWSVQWFSQFFIFRLYPASFLLSSAPGSDIFHCSQDTFILSPSRFRRLPPMKQHIRNGTSKKGFYLCNRICRKEHHKKWHS